jgi:hypothetical protein
MVAGGSDELWQRAVEVCRHFELTEPARALLHERQSPGEFFSLLVQERLYADAVRFAAHYLPKRHAVWWGCLCLWDVYRPSPSDKAAAALHATVRWVRAPGEDNRRAAEKAGRVAGVGSAAGGLALAAYLSEGSIAPPGQPAVAPGPCLTARTLAGAVLLAAKQAGAARRVDCERQFVLLAADVAEGRLPWDVVPALDAAAGPAGRR